MNAVATATLRLNLGEEETAQIASLEGLAANYRFVLARSESVVVAIDGHQFWLYPQRNLCRSSNSLGVFSEYRGKDSVRIEVATATDPGPKDAGVGGPQGRPTPRRLDEFLWHLGYNAGAGNLVPWLSPDRVYRLTRWPPIVRKDSDSTMVRMGSLIARRALHPAELARASGALEPAVADFLNGCSLVGCLEAPKPTEAAVRRALPKKNLLMANLLGRIRLKLGLA